MIIFNVIELCEIQFVQVCGVLNSYYIFPCKGLISQKVLKILGFEIQLLYSLKWWHQSFNLQM